MMSNKVKKRSNQASPWLTSDEETSEAGSKPNNPDRICTKTDPSHDAKCNVVRIHDLETEQAKNPRSFGAIIISRPFYDKGELKKFRVHTVNPGIVQSWIGPKSNHQAAFYSCLPFEGLMPDSDVRLFYNVNEIRVRIPTHRLRTQERGSSDSTWIEEGSGNEFLIQSDAWTFRP